MLACGAAGAFVLGAGGCNTREVVWIYTTLPKDVISEMVEPLEAAVPEADVKWFQSGSEKLETRLSSEFEAAEVKADLVLTNDPLWYVDMKRKGKLLPYQSPAVKDLAPELKDPEGHFAAVRLAVMVMAYNPGLFKGEAPERWKDLASPRFERKLSMASPQESPQAFIAISMLSKLFGWEFFGGLRKQGLVSEGSPSSVISRIETGERPVGMLPLDSILRASRGKSALKIIYPQEGGILVPGPIAILKDSAHPETARKIYDWFYAQAAQTAIVRGGSYSPLPKFASPEGSRPWPELQPLLMKWEAGAWGDLYAQRDRVRAKFSEVVLH